VASAVLLKAANGLAIVRIKANWSSETGVSTIGKFLVIWEGLKCHRSRLVWDFVRQQQGRIWLEFLPASKSQAVLFLNACARVPGSNTLIRNFTDIGICEMRL